MEYEEPQIIMDEQLLEASKKPIKRMLDISHKYGSDMSKVCNSW